MNIHHTLNFIISMDVVKRAKRICPKIHILLAKIHIGLRLLGSQISDSHIFFGSHPLV